MDIPSVSICGPSSPNHHTTPHDNHFTALFRDHPGKPVPEENFWTLWCKGRLTEADTPTIWLGATLSVLTSAHLYLPPPIFLQAGCPSCRPTNSVKALKATVGNSALSCPIPPRDVEIPLGSFHILKPVCSPVSLPSVCYGAVVQRSGHTAC